MMNQTIKQTHPIRGALWGIPLGIGLAVVLVVTQVIPLDLTQMIIVLVAAIVVGVLWGMYGPAKKPKGPPPRGTVSAPAEISDEGGPDEPAPAGPDGAEQPDWAAEDPVGREDPSTDPAAEVEEHGAEEGPDELP